MKYFRYIHTYRSSKDSKQRSETLYTYVLSGEEEAYLKARKDVAEVTEVSKEEFQRAIVDLRGRGDESH